MPEVDSSPPPGGPPDPSFETGADAISSRSHDDGSTVVQTLPVDDLDRLLDCIAEIAVRRPDRFHVRMESIHPAAPACVARALDACADRLPATWSKALRDGWPPAL